MGLPIPKNVRVLGASVDPVSITRLDARTLMLECVSGYSNAISDPLIRVEDEPMPLGHRYKVSGLEIEVVETTAHGEPKKVLARFDNALEHPSLRFVTWDVHGYKDFAIPKVGETVHMDIDGRRVIIGP